MVNELDVAMRIYDKVIEYSNKKMFETDISLYLDAGTDEFRAAISEMRMYISSLLSSLSDEEERQGVFALIFKLIQVEIVDMLKVGMMYAITNRYLSTVTYNKASLLTHIQNFLSTCIIGVYVPQK